MSAPGAQLAAGSARDARFEAAKSASVQRAVSSVGLLDSMSVAASRGTGAATTRAVGGRTFALRDGVWTDARFTPTMQTTKIKPYSAAYFDVLAQLPELRAVFALGSRLIGVGRDRAIALSDDGAETLAAPALAALVKSW
jgi:hypothetical protein